jgi:hypothetical protein
MPISRKNLLNRQRDRVDKAVDDANIANDEQNKETDVAYPEDHNLLDLPTSDIPVDDPATVPEAGMSDTMRMVLVVGAVAVVVALASS